MPAALAMTKTMVDGHKIIVTESRFPLIPPLQYQQLGGGGGGSSVVAGTSNAQGHGGGGMQSSGAGSVLGFKPRAVKLNVTHAQAHALDTDKVK